MCAERRETEHHLHVRALVFPTGTGEPKSTEAEILQAATQHDLAPNEIDPSIDAKTGMQASLGHGAMIPGRTAVTIPRVSMTGRRPRAAGRCGTRLRVEPAKMAARTACFRTDGLQAAGITSFFPVYRWSPVCIAPGTVPFHMRVRSFRSLARTLSLTMFIVGMVGSLACKGGPTIPGTEIPDTTENREILKVLERYRTGFVQRNPALMLSTAHPTYYDQAGTDDPGDDVVYDELPALLRTRMTQLEAVRYTIDYLEIHIYKNRATVYVWVDASFRMKPILDADGVSRVPLRYTRKQDHSMFELVREGEGWLITRGM